MKNRFFNVMRKNARNEIAKENLRKPYEIYLTEENAEVTVKDVMSYALRRGGRVSDYFLTEISEMEMHRGKVI